MAEAGLATTPTDMPVITACFSEPILDSKQPGPPEAGLFPALLWNMLADVDNEEKAKCEQCPSPSR